MRFVLFYVEPRRNHFGNIITKEEVLEIIAVKWQAPVVYTSSLIQSYNFIRAGVLPHVTDEAKVSLCTHYCAHVDAHIVFVLPRFVFPHRVFVNWKA